MPDFRPMDGFPDPYAMYDVGYDANRIRQKLNVEDRMAAGLAVSQARAGYPSDYPNVSFGVRARSIARSFAKGGATVT